MKSLIRKIFNYNVSKKIRNSIGFYPEYFNIPNKNNFSISDSFLWRTDKNFSTIFKFTDIPQLADIPTKQLVSNRFSTVNKYTQQGLFTDIPNDIWIGRYHNDSVNEESLKDTPLTATAHSDGMVMAVRHDTLPIESFQLHPESQMTEYGDEILQNFLNLG